MKHLKHIYEMDGNDIPWASPYRLGSGGSIPVTMNNLPKPGDKVRCVIGFEEVTGLDGGSGYEPGRIVIVGRVDLYDRPIIWPINGGNGIYFDALEYID
jgi:hypothetical protein